MKLDDALNSLKEEFQINSNIGSDQSRFQQEKQVIDNAFAETLKLDLHKDPLKNRAA